MKINDLWQIMYVHIVYQKLKEKDNKKPQCPEPSSKAYESEC